MRWPVDETGMNSVIPSTTPKIRLFNRRIRSIYPEIPSATEGGNPAAPRMLPVKIV
jgi:hypothetical protein